MAVSAAASGSDLFTTSLDAEKLKGFSMRELNDLREGMVTVSDVLAGLLCQPRHSRDRSCVYSTVGEVLSLLDGLARRIADEVEDEACRRNDASGDDAKLRAWVLIRARAERQDDEGSELEALVKSVGS